MSGGNRFCGLQKKNFTPRKSSELRGARTEVARVFRGMTAA
jgi:hypothetical protein